MTRRAALLLPLAFVAGLAAGHFVARRAPGAVPPAPPPVIRVAPGPAETPGSGAIRGRVRTDRGVPVAGARIVATVVATGEAAGETRTSEDGAFVLGGLPEGPFLLRGFHESFDLSEAMAQAGETVEIAAVPALGLVVRVLLPDGTAPAEAELSCVLRSSPETPLVRSWRPDAPRITLPAGSFDIGAVAGADREFASETGRIHLRAGEPSPVLTLNLSALAGVRGRVVLPLSLAMRRVRVCASNVEDPPARLGDCEAREDGDFRYAITGLPPGRCRLSLAGFAERAFPPVEVTVTAGMTERDLVVPEPAAADAILVRALAPDGSPVFSPDVEVGSPADPQGWEHDWEDLDAGPGKRLLWIVGEHDPDAYVRVSDPDLGARKAPLPPPGGSVTVRFAEPAWLTVVVRGLPAGDMADEFEIRIASTPESEAAEMASFLLDPDEPMVFGPLQPGPVLVELRLEEQVLASWTTLLVSGTNRLSANAPQLHDLCVKVPEGGAGSLTLRRESDGVVIERCEWDDDLTVFPVLPAGRYVLELAAGLPRDGRMVIDVPASGTVEFAAERCDALRVAEVWVDGPLDQAGLRAGDLVLAVDGEEIGGAAQGRALLALAAMRKSVKLDILRNSARLTLTVPGPALADEDAATFEPATR